MKLPIYIKVGKIRAESPGEPFSRLVVTVRIKWWGVCWILFKAMRDHRELPWRRWVLYPKCCYRALRGVANGHL